MCELGTWVWMEVRISIETHCTTTWIIFKGELYSGAINYVDMMEDYLF
jgi:hypothetical protein